MGKGLLAGLFWGVVSVAGLGLIAAVLLPPPPSAQRLPEAVAPVPPPVAEAPSEAPPDRPDPTAARPEASEEAAAPADAAPAPAPLQPTEAPRAAPPPMESAAARNVESGAAPQGPNAAEAEAPATALAALSRPQGAEADPARPPSEPAPDAVESAPAPDSAPATAPRPPMPDTAQAGAGPARSAAPLAPTVPSAPEPPAAAVAAVPALPLAASGAAARVPGPAALPVATEGALAADTLSERAISGARIGAAPPLVGLAVSEPAAPVATAGTLPALEEPTRAPRPAGDGPMVPPSGPDADAAPDTARAAQPAARAQVAGAPHNLPRLSVAAPPSPPTQQKRTGAAEVAALLPAGAPEPAAAEVVAAIGRAVPAPPAPPPVATGRLPQIGAEEPAAGTTGADAPEADSGADSGASAGADAGAGDLPALLRHAVGFERDDRPLFAPVLLDAGLDAAARARLAALPHALSIAVDPAAPGAAEAAAAYRAAGKEVVMLATQIPPRATPADLEVTFASHRATLRQAVAVMDLPTGGFQDSRRLSQQIATILTDEGLGLITHDRGLNPAAQVAAQAGLPHAAVFRDLAGAGGESGALRRLLERVRFRAGQQGAAVVLVAGTGPELEALLTWLDEGRDAGVALAPVSAVLLGTP